MIIEDEEENPYLKKPKKLALITIIVMVAKLILHPILYIVAGWDDSGEGVIHIFQTVTWGIVVPVIIIVLAIIGSSLLNQFEEEDYIALFIGIAYVILAALTLFMMSLWVYPTVLEFLANPEYWMFYLGFLTCIAVALIMQILILIAGVRNIQYYNDQLH
jgi:hypothetical protein